MVLTNGPNNLRWQAVWTIIETSEHLWKDRSKHIDSRVSRLLYFFPFRVLSYVRPIVNHGPLKVVLFHHHPFSVSRLASHVQQSGRKIYFFD